MSDVGSHRDCDLALRVFLGEVADCFRYLAQRARTVNHWSDLVFTGRAEGMVSGFAV
jgi:hypothetical protein